MADEIVAKYKVDVSGASAALDQLAAKTQKTGQTLDDSFNKGSDGVKRLQSELAKQPKTLADLELRLVKLKELLRDDTKIGTEGFKQVTKAINDTNAAIAKTNTELAETPKKTGLVTDGMKKVGAAILAAFAVERIISFVKQSVELAAKAEGVERAFKRVGSETLLDGLRRATRNTVNDLTLMTTAVQASNFKIPLENLAKYMEFANARARETGKSVDYLIESILTGVGRGSIEVWDNMGISLSDVRSRLNGVSIESLSVADRAKLMSDIVTEELAKMGTQADTTADRLGQLATVWDNIEVQAGGAFIKLGTGLAYLLGLLPEVNVEAEVLAKTMGSFKEIRLNQLQSGYKSIEEVVDELIKKQSDSNQLQLTLIELQERLVKISTGSRNSEVIKEQNTLRDRIKIIQEMITKYGAQATVLKEIVDLELAREDASKNSKQIENLFSVEKAIKDLTDEMNGEFTSMQRIKEILPLINALEEQRKTILGEETIAAKNKRLAEEALLKIEEKRAEEYNKAQEAEAERLLKQEEDNAKERVKIAEDMAKMLIDIERYLATTSEEIRDAELADIQRNYEKDLAFVINAGEEQVSSVEEQTAAIVLLEKERDKLIEQAEQDHSDRIFAINKELADKKRDLAQDELDKEEEDKEMKQRLFEAIANTTVQLIGMVSQAQQESYQRDLDNLQERLNQGLISEEEYDKEKRTLLRKQNEAAKQAAIFQAIINTAVAVTAAAGVPGIGFALAILAGILGAAQIAVIASQQPPQFAKGVVDLQGEGTATSDSIHAKLSKGESVITAKETSKHKGLLEAMNKGLAEKYILSNYVKPALDSAMLSGFADMGKSAEVNGLTANLKDHNIIAAMDRHRAADVAGFKMLAAKLDRRQPKRGGYA